MIKPKDPSTAYVTIEVTLTWAEIAEDIYRYYRHCLRDKGFERPEWNHLNEADKQAWETIAIYTAGNFKGGWKHLITKQKIDEAVCEQVN